MEVKGDNKVNIDLRTGHATNAYQPPPPLTEQELGRASNNPLEAHSHIPDINQAPVTSLSSSFQNPFIGPSEATNDTVEDDTNIGSSNTHIYNSPNEIHSSTNVISNLNSPTSTYELSQESSFNEKTNTNNSDSDDVVKSWQTQPSPCDIVSTNVESHHPFKEIEKGQQGVDDTIHTGTSSFPTLESLNQEQTCASINVTSNANQDLGLASRMVGESNNNEVATKSEPNHQHSDVAEHSTPTSSNQNIEHHKIKGPEIQNPPIQLMERPSENVTNAQYVFPSHVFARNNTNAPVEWSTASNESLFSIYMGNTSFSSELACFKSSDLDKSGDVCMSDQYIASPNHQPPVPVNKFNAISKGTAELHEEGLKVTEAKAAETMREVIMESSQTTKYVVKKEDKKSNSRHQSHGSTGSYAFKTSKDGDKSVSSKGVGENNTPNMKSEQNEKTEEVDQTQKSNTDAPPNRWLSCFSCCTFCH
ncbi:hypothetical protein MtrunA17_Chr4g0061481 [Medicago truncatula]|uniref:Uncharacterized protein n=1 Tax=Medicago truncatula TaxID=3880 RepID=A0A396IDU9_MEDTR|nr:hypothetical protein MtrunA17_Chr4g0061481 [Medicago truncatula]